MIDSAGERTFVASAGADGHVSIDDLNQLAALDFEWLLLSGYALHYRGSRLAMQQWLCTNPPVKNLVFDPSPVVALLAPEALSAACEKATWISANAREAAVLTGETDPMKAAVSLARNAPKDGGTIVRDGKNGCVVATPEYCEYVEAFPVTPIDTNGAGDAHIGSFIARLAKGDTPLDAARYANVAAALSTTRQGPATAPDKDHVLEALRRKEAV